MRYTYEHMKSMLQGAYKKLKSYYFYDKTLLFIKKKIAEFESDDGCFQQTFDVLAKALSSAIEFMGSWTSVFELILQLKILSGDKRKRDPFAQRFYRDIVYYIDYKLTFDLLDPKEIYSKKKATVFRRLKRDLKDRLGTSIAMAMALDYRWKATVSAQKKNIELAKKFRKSNIFNHNLISFPLLNYLPFDQIATRSFLEIQKEPWSDSGVFSLDTQRLFWTPRFIHLDELFIYYFMQSTQNEKKNFNGKSDIEAICIM